MKSVGIICEYNPFHNGHLYHLNKVKEMFPEHVIVLVLSGGFMQRGDVSLLSKWDKTEIALSFGIDLVVELPFVFASQSADLFARGSIEILSYLHVEHLVFGSESGDISIFNSLASIQNTEVYQEKVRYYLQEGFNYPTAMAKALGGDYNISKPNDILGLCYVKEIISQNSSLVPHTILRTNDYHDLELNDKVSSATSIRKALKNGEDVSYYVPLYTSTYLKNDLFFIENYFPFIKYKIMSEIDYLDQYQSVDEGLSTRIRKVIYSCNSLEELVIGIKTKRYTYNRICRMLVHILCGFRKDEAKRFQHVSYIRVLGFSSVGQSYLKSVKKSVDVPIITNYSSIQNDMLALEFRVNSVYASILPEEKKNYLIRLEYSHKPIIK